ncbi:MAG: hypothetical protein ACPG7U_02860 [Holosporaceae bacterium]
MLVVWTGLASFGMAEDGTTEKALVAKPQKPAAKATKTPRSDKSALESVEVDTGNDLEVMSHKDKMALLYSIPKKVRSEKTAITCKHLIRNQLTMPPDGRVDRICGAAMQACIVFESLKFLERHKQSPFSPEKTRYLRLFSEAQTKRWRAFCHASRVAFRNPKFQEEVFDWNNTSGRDAEKL